MLTGVFLVYEVVVDTLPYKLNTDIEPQGHFD